MLVFASAPNALAKPGPPIGHVVILYIFYEYLFILCQYILTADRRAPGNLWMTQGGRLRKSKSQPSAEITVDNFAGGGGASAGIEAALGRPIDYAINHDAQAIAMHAANHPNTHHFCESVWDVDPTAVAAGRPVGLGWFSPDCTFHSKARGGKPFRDRNLALRRRGLAWVVVRWAKAVRPRVIMLENVEEFCFPANTAVLSKRGVISISDIAVGDEVWTHNARWKPVLAVSVKNSKTVFIAGYGNSIIETTPSHRFYARQYAPEITVSGKFGRHETRLLEPEWVSAERLADVDDSTAYSKQYSGYAWASPLKLPRYWMRMPNAFEVDTTAPAFFYMIGRWLGDGWIRKRKARQHLVRICANLAEADALGQCLARTGLTWRRESHSDSVDTFDLCARSSATLIPWLVGNFGQFAAKKTLPAWVFGASEEQRWALIEGYCDADGHEQKSGRVAMSSVSRCLAVGLRLLLQSLGVAASLSKIEAHVSVRTDGIGNFRSSEAYTVSWRRESQWEKGHRSDLHIWGRVRAVTPATAETRVYDITVADDHSFIADGQVVHNSNWGPLLPDGTPCPKRRGTTFRRWHRQIENLGYQVDMRELKACDYGAPTSRKRLFVIARSDGEEIVFPEATHGFSGSPYRTAAECIDWDLECPSIFTKGRGLCENTLRRIGRGIQRYVMDDPQPFIVTSRGTSDAHLSASARGIHEPLRTISAGRGVHHNLVVPTLINTRNGERPGQAPRIVTAAGSQGPMVAAFLAKHYGGHETDGARLSAPISTVTARDHHALVYAFLLKYYGTDQAPSLKAPLHTIRTKDCFALVTINSEQYRIVDIGMRHLVPRELYRAQSFSDGYIIDPPYNGKPMTKTAQVRMCGNSVPPVVARALVSANLPSRENSPRTRARPTGPRRRSSNIQKAVARKKSAPAAQIPK